jgi:hypothetical protein
MQRFTGGLVMVFLGCHLLAAGERTDFSGVWVNVVTKTRISKATGMDSNAVARAGIEVSKIPQVKRQVDPGVARPSRMTITQSDREIKIESVSLANGMAAMPVNEIFNLDGEQQVRNIQNANGEQAKQIIKAKIAKNNFEAKLTRETSQVKTYEISKLFELSKDGKQLTVKNVEVQLLPPMLKVEIITIEVYDKQ